MSFEIYIPFLNDFILKSLNKRIISSSIISKLGYSKSEFKLVAN